MLVKHIMPLANTKFVKFVSKQLTHLINQTPETHNHSVEQAQAACLVNQTSFKRDVYLCTSLTIEAKTSDTENTKKNFGDYTMVFGRARMREAQAIHPREGSRSKET
jgi:hypothetical protein